MSDNLPNPIPAGSRIHIYVGNGFQRTHTLTAPLHHLTPEMVEAVRKARSALALCPSLDHTDAYRELGAAFTHVLTPPVVEGPTVREHVLGSADSKERDMILATYLGAVIARLDKAGI